MRGEGCSCTSGEFRRQTWLINTDLEPVSGEAVFTFLVPVCRARGADGCLSEWSEGSSLFLPRLLQSLGPGPGYKKVAREPSLGLLGLGTVQLGLVWGRACHFLHACPTPGGPQERRRSCGAHTPKNPLPVSEKNQKWRPGASRVASPSHSGGGERQGAAPFCVLSDRASVQSGWCSGWCY